MGVPRGTQVCTLWHLPAACQQGRHAGALFVIDVTDCDLSLAGG
jgi:hypothetical protein